MNNVSFSHDEPAEEGRYERRTQYINLLLGGSDVISPPHSKPCTKRIAEGSGIKVAVTRTEDGDFLIRVCKHLERR